MTYQPDFCHIRHSDSGPALCGEVLGFSEELAPGLPAFSCWPFESYCPECLSLHTNGESATYRGKVVSGSDTSVRTYCTSEHSRNV